MVQEMNILRCYSCNMFQVHIVKKANKWQCKICNEKQSIQHIYYQGSGQDCRLQVQHLNFTRYVKDQQTSGKLDKLENFAKQASSVSEVQKPVITHSKWAKYMVPREESCKAGNASSDINTFQENLSNNKESIDEKFIDVKRTEGSLPSARDFSRNFTTSGSKCDNKSITIHTMGCFGSSNTLYRNSNYGEDDVSSIEKRRLPSSTSTSSSYTHFSVRSKSELINEDDSPPQSNDSSCNSIEGKQSIIIIGKHEKRKSDCENVVPETEFDSSSSDRESTGVLFKRSKLVDEILIRKQNLRDIVGLNRSKAGKSLDKIVENSGSVVRNNNLVLRDINYSFNTRVNGAEILQPSSKKKTIFETDCDDLDEILDS